MTPRQTISNLCRTSVLMLAFALATGSAVAATYNLVAMPFDMDMPNGATIPMWGFALDGASPVPSVPGPPLVVPPGDTSLTINLRNTLPEPVSIVIPGQTASMVPVKVTDGSGRQRVRSFTAESAAGNGTQIYTWNNLKPGTYLYHSGTHPQVQVQMGLYGAMTHDSAAGEIYAGVSYASQIILLFSEIDPVLHSTVAAGQYGPGMAVSSTIDYAPKYFLINGAVFPDLFSVLFETGSVGQTTLLHFLNAGLQSRSPLLQGMHMRLVAEDGNPYPYAREQYSIFLPPLKTVDALITPSSSGIYPLYDRRLGVTSPGVAGSTSGGMLTALSVPTAPSGAPSAGNDTYALNEDALPNFSVAAPGVLGNDSAGTTASLVSGTSHGSLNLAADGSFTYTPQANYNGADSFTYRAMSGGVGSAPATVSLTVNPVNDVPVALGDVYSVAEGTLLNVAAPGVLGNDSDVDGNALTAVNPSALAGLTFNPDGSFSYNAATAGSYSFTYQASDGIDTSAAATVAITVLANQAPVAVNDTASAPRRTAVLYTPVIINVLANDSDPNGNLVPGTVTLVTQPNRGGVVSVNADGTLNYTPRRNFRGTENFRYRVQDSGGLWSNNAVVRVNVQ